MANTIAERTPEAGRIPTSFRASMRIRSEDLITRAAPYISTGGVRTQPSTLRRSRKAFGLSFLIGYVAVLSLLLFLRAPVDLIVEVSLGITLTGFAVLRGWPPRPPHPRLSRKGSRRAGVLVPLGIVALSTLLSYDWRGNPPGFRPDAVPIIVSGLAVGFIIVVAAWGASRPWRACPACGRRLPGWIQIKKCPYCGHLFS